MLHREIPFLRICVALCSGIVTGLYFEPSSGVPVTAIIFFTFLLFAGIKFKIPENNACFGVVLTAALFCCGLALYDLEKKSLSTLNPEEAIYRCIVDDYPQKKQSTLMTIVELKARISDNGQQKIKGSLLLYHRDKTAENTFIPGNIIYLKLKPVQITNRGNPYEFDYKFYMENHGIRYLAYTSPDDIIDLQYPSKRKLAHKGLIIRHKIIEMYSKRGVSRERLPLVAALTLGDKTMLEQDTKDNFMKAGIMHIMAVSGLHAVILSLFIFRLLFFLNGKLSLLRIILTVLLLWSFAFVTGLTPSVMRATLMFSFLQAGNLMKRKVNGINSVLASAFVLILLRPSVIFDAGFLLSYSAVIFIIAFYSGVSSYISIPNPFQYLWKSAAVTIVAQAGTLPLTLHLFNNFPPYFILTNIIIVPLSSLIVILGCIVPLTYPFEFFSALAGSLLDSLTGLTGILTETAATLPVSSIGNIGLTVPECIALSCFLFALFWVLVNNKRNIVLPVALFLLYFTINTFKTYIVSTTNELIVYNTQGINIGIRTGKYLHLYSDTTMYVPDVIKHSSSLNLVPEIVKIENPGMMLAGDKKITIVRSQKEINKYLNYSEFIILTGNCYDLNIDTAGSSHIIVTGNYYGKTGDITDKYRVYSVRKSGAYRTKL